MSSYTITIADETFDLVCSRKAAQAISRKCGGLSAAQQGVLGVNLDVMRNIVLAGAGLDARDADRIDDLIFEAGSSALLRPLTEYLNMLFNGGKVPTGSGGGEPAGE